MCLRASKGLMELLGKSKEELRAFCAVLGEPAFRGAQVYHALYSERKFDVAQITNLPAALRERLGKEARVALLEVKQRFAAADGSVRYLFGLGSAEENKDFNTEFAENIANTEKSGKERASRLQKPALVEAVFMPRGGGRRFVFRRKRDALWIAIFALRRSWD